MEQKSIKSSFFCVAVAKYLNVIIGIVFAAIMARLLTPDDYGIFSVVSVIDSFFLTASEFGIGSGVIQNLNLTNKDIDGIFTFMGWIGIGFGILISVLGIPLSIYYQESAYIIICPMLFLANLFYALDVVPNATMLRQGKYEAIAIRNIVTGFISLVIGVIMAFEGFKSYSLVVRMIAMYVLSFIWNQATVRLKVIPNVKKVLASVRKIAAYSAYRFLGDVAYYGELNLDNFAIGARLGSISLAYYDKAYRLLDYPVGNLAGVLNTVLHPMLKDYQNEKNVMLHKYLSIQRIFSLISIVLVTVCFLCSKEMIFILYGSQWEKAVITFSTMAFAIYPKMLLSTMNSVFSSLGDTKLLFHTQIKRTVIVLISVLCGVSIGTIEAVAAGIVLSSWINYFMTSATLIRRGFKYKWNGFVKPYISDMVFMAIATLFFYAFFVKFMPECGNMVSLIAKSLLIGSAYIAYYFLGGGIRDLSLLVPGKIKNLLKRKEKV